MSNPLNEAGITATFAAIFDRLDRLEAIAAARSTPSSTANAPEVPQGPGNGTERNTGSECEASPFEASVLDDQMLCYIANDGPKRDGHRVHNDITAVMATELLAARASLGELSADDLRAAIRVWRKVQACERRVETDDDGAVSEHIRIKGDDGETSTYITRHACTFLAWLKDGEA